MTSRLTLPPDPAPLPPGAWRLVEGPARLEWRAGAPPVQIAASQAPTGTIIHAHPALYVAGPATVVPHATAAPAPDHDWLISALLSLLSPGSVTAIPAAHPSASLAPLLNATAAARRSAAREHQALLQSHGPGPVETIDQTLEAARAALPRNPAHHYATLTLLRIAAPANGKPPPIVWSTIGHRHPVFSRAIRPTILRTATAQRPSGTALGLPGFTPPPVYAAPASRDLSVLIATDGVTDALTSKQLQRVLAGGSGLPLRTLASRILRLARLLHPTEQDPDDRSVLLLRTT